MENEKLNVGRIKSEDEVMYEDEHVYKTKYEAFCVQKQKERTEKLVKRLCEKQELFRNDPYSYFESYTSLYRDETLQAAADIVEYFRNSNCSLSEIQMILEEIEKALPDHSFL